MENNTPSEQPIANAHKKHKLIIVVLGLIIVALVVTLFTKTSEAPGPEETNLDEEVSETAEDEGSENDDGSDTSNWKPPSYQPPAAPQTPSENPSPVSPPTTQTPGNTIPSKEQLGEEISVPKSTIVTLRDGRFWPDEVVVLEGGMVHFVNQSDEKMWIASDNHPKHDRYPEKAEDNCAGSDFDMCTSIESGESWTFTFHRSGTWGYHNHVDAKVTGKIIVVDKDDV